MAWDELGKTLNSFVEERLTSPLTGTFIVSWCLWNYKFLVILFSNASVTDTFRLIQVFCFSGPFDIFIKGFIAPLSTTLLYIYVYPWPARKVFEFWRAGQNELAKIRRQLEEEKPLTNEEAREIRAARYKAEDELEKLAAQYRQLREDYSKLKTQSIQIEDERPADASDLTKTLDFSSATESKPSSFPSDGTSNNSPLSSEAESLLNSFVELDGEITRDSWNEMHSKEFVRDEYLLDQLKAGGFVTEQWDNGVNERTIRLTPLGRKRLFEPTRTAAQALPPT